MARDVTLGRPVAIKLLDPEVAANETIRRRFLREARTAGLLSQPNIVPIHTVEEHGDIVFFVMGYVAGETLGQRIRQRGMLEIREATRLLTEVAWALAYAHARGITHRDVKPDNVMVERHGGRALVTDFGIARHADDPHGDEIVGTAYYMSPEQAAGHPPLSCQGPGRPLRDCGGVRGRRRRRNASGTCGRRQVSPAGAEYHESSSKSTRYANS